MDILEYIKENLFSYKVDIPSLSGGEKLPPSEEAISDYNFGQERRPRGAAFYGNPVSHDQHSEGTISWN
jgi:hypothetical protein